MTYMYLHNPKCSKSRQGLALLEGRDDVLVRLYLEDPLTFEELEDLNLKLGGGAAKFLRTKDAKKDGLDIEGAGDTAILTAMAAVPKIIERPILISEDSAIIGRPPEDILKLL